MYPSQYLEYHPGLKHNQKHYKYLAKSQFSRLASKGHSGVVHSALKKAVHDQDSGWSTKNKDKK